MTTNQTEVESPAVVRGDDAYHLTPEGIKGPPKGWGPSPRYFGPGPILSASIVGSGEPIATTALGATRCSSSAASPSSCWASTRR